MKKKYAVLIAFLIVLVSQITLVSCNNEVNEGEELAKTHCSSCHQFPEPELLPKNVWQLSVLPYMGMIMGLDKETQNLPAELQAYAMLKAPQAMISAKDYDKIKAYYIDKAPKTLEREPYAELETLSGLFVPKQLNVKTKDGKIPNYTAVKIDPYRKTIIAGDQANRLIWNLDANGKILNQIDNQNALSYVDVHKDKASIFTYIGYTTQANPLEGGSVRSFSSSNLLSENVLKELHRPIESLAADLDGDGNDELITNEFGFLKGGLSVWKKNNKGTYIQNIISPQTGATKTIIKDFNGDKKPDILSLCAQGDEQIVLYINKGNLKFEAKQLLRFPSIYGSSSFDIADINGDGLFDIVYTAGDNADFTTVLKPYHGVYIFLNKGDFKFEQSQFFPQNGATKVISGDFDLDGDIDLVSIALFPDVEKRPLEGFMYLENSGKGFIQKTLPINHLGRWAVIDSGDIDGDGDLDLILGSHPVAKFPAGFDQAWKEGSGLVLLENKTK